MSDEEAIRELIAEHFEPMRWSEGTEPDWDRFRKDFLEGALLCGSVRPAHPRTLEEFIERMETVARKNLASFEEHTRGMKILAMSELLEDGSDINHDISGYLLVKSEGQWSIMAHAWDQADENKPVPDQLRA